MAMRRLRRNIKNENAEKENSSANCNIVLEVEPQRKIDFEKIPRLDKVSDTESDFEITFKQSESDNSVGVLISSMFTLILNSTYPTDPTQPLRAAFKIFQIRFLDSHSMLDEVEVAKFNFIVAMSLFRKATPKSDSFFALLLRLKSIVSILVEEDLKESELDENVKFKELAMDIYQFVDRDRKSYYELYELYGFININAFMTAKWGQSEWESEKNRLAEELRVLCGGQEIK